MRFSIVAVSVFASSVLATRILYSTKEVTFTNCPPTYTDCPSRPQPPSNATLKHPGPSNPIGPIILSTSVYTTCVPTTQTSVFTVEPTVGPAEPIPSAGIPTPPQAKTTPTNPQLPEFTAAASMIYASVALAAAATVGTIFL